MYPTTYTSFLHNSSTSIYAARPWNCTQDFHHTLYKTPTHLLQSSTCTTCDNHTISSFTFNILIPLSNLLRFFSRLVPCPPCFATFHILCTAKPHLLKGLKTQFIYVYIYISSLLPKSIQRCQTFVETTYRLKFNHRRLLTEWLTSKDLLENAPSMFVTRYTQFPFPHLLRRFRGRKKTQPIQSRVWREERETHREKSGSKKRIKSKAQLCTLSTRRR